MHVSLIRHQLLFLHAFTHTNTCFICIWIIYCFPKSYVFLPSNQSYFMSAQTPPATKHCKIKYHVKFTILKISSCGCHKFTVKTTVTMLYALQDSIWCLYILQIITRYSYHVKYTL